MIPSHRPPNKNRLILLALATTLFFPCGSALRAAVLVDYQFLDTDPSSPVSVPANTELTDAILGNPGNPTGMVFSASPANNVAWTQATTGGGTNNSETKSLLGNWYIEFTLTPDTGYTLDLDSLTFDFGGSSSTANYDANFFVRTSLDSFALNVGATQTIHVPASSNSRNVPGDAAIDLSAAMFQDVDTAVTFRIYGYASNESTVSANNRPRLDNLVLNGEVTAVPEPGTVALAVIGMGAFTIFRRKVRAHSL